MIGGSSHERALLASLAEVPELRLTTIQKTLVAVEKGAVKPTHRISQALRRVIQSIETNDPGVIQTLAGYSNRVRGIDPRRHKVADIPDSESFASRIFGDIPDRTDDDVWDSAPPLPLAEALRLSSLRGADPRAMIFDALDGREFSVATLRKLHAHLKDCFSAGGVSLSTGPLYPEVTRILQSQGAIAADDMAETTFGVSLLEELNARN
jgi:hypothetical protein